MKKFFFYKIKIWTSYYIFVSIVIYLCNIIEKGKTIFALIIYICFKLIKIDNYVLIDILILNIYYFITLMNKGFYKLNIDYYF